MYKIVLSKQAVKDARRITQAGLRARVEKLIEVLQENPFRSPPFYERLVGNLDGFYARRINIQHRLVYEVFLEEKKVRILRMWSHYE